MICTTTSNLDGEVIEKYLGVVVGEAILGANILKDLFGAVRDIVGGRAGAYENELSRAREIAFAEIEQAASSLGANALIGIDIDYEVVGKKGAMMMVSVSGTDVGFRHKS